MANTLQPIGIVLPVAYGPFGYFNQSFNVLDQIRANITMLLKTKKGEHRMNPTFGSGLWNVIFEGNDENLNQIAESTVRRDVDTWLPYVSIVSVKVKNDTEERNQYRINISVLFTVNSVGITTPQNLELTVQQ